MDVIALLWPVLAVGAVLGHLAAAMLTKRRVLVLPALSWIVAFALVVIVPWRPLGGPAPVAGLRIVAANAYGNNSRPPAQVAAALVEQRPDVLVVSELTPDLFAALRSRFASMVIATTANRTGASDVGVFSRYPLEGVDLPPDLIDQRGVRVVVRWPARSIVLYGLHLQKPGDSTSQVEVGFRTYHRIVTRVAEDVRREREPVVVAGDLNLSDRTTGYRQLTNVLDDAMRAGWVGPTSLRPTTRPLLARIDHVFMPAHWCRTGSHLFAIPGSDHRGVATVLGPCPRRANA